MSHTQNSTPFEQMQEAQAERKEDVQDFQNELVEQDQELHQETGEVAPVEPVVDWEPTPAQPTGEPQEEVKPAKKAPAKKKSS